MDYQDDVVHLQPKITCPKCGSDQMRYDPELGDESPVTCNACKHSLGKLSEAKKVATQNALNNVFKSEAQKAFGDAVRDEDGITFEPK